MQEEDEEWSPEELKMVKNTFSQNCPGTFGVLFAIITGTQEQVQGVGTNQIFQEKF